METLIKARLPEARASKLTWLQAFPFVHLRTCTAVIVTCVFLLFLAFWPPPASLQPEVRSMLARHCQSAHLGRPD